MSNDVEVVREEFDQVKLFQLFVLFGGDTRRVAVVARVPEETVKSLAHDFNWKGKLNGRKSLDSEEGLAEERSMNRAINYVVADQLHTVFSNLIQELNKDPTFARQFCTSVDEEGQTSFNTKNLVELAKGVEIVSNVKYRALGDKLAAEADVSGKGGDLASFSLNIYKQLQNRFDAMPAVDVTSKIADAVREVQANDSAAV